MECDPEDTRKSAGIGWTHALNVLAPFSIAVTKLRRPTKFADELVPKCPLRLSGKYDLRERAAVNTNMLSIHALAMEVDELK